MASRDEIDPNAKMPSLKQMADVMTGQVYRDEIADLKTALEQSRLELARLREALGKPCDCTLGLHDSMMLGKDFRCHQVKAFVSSPTDSKAWLAGEIEKRVGPLREAAKDVLAVRGLDMERNPLPAYMERPFSVLREIIKATPAPTDAKGEMK